MKFGVFDQNDRSGLPLTEQYEKRLTLAELYDRLGFYAFHMSEHHGVPLSMTPSPSVWMAALTQRTKRLRLCPLVYLLPTYHPARLYEEMCILDHLSHGRFDFGVGRGASPHELDALGIDATKASKMYAEAFETIQRCFAQDSVTTTGEFWSLKDYAVEMKPLQRPHPPMWYAVGSPELGCLASAKRPERRLWRASFPRACDFRSISRGKDGGRPSERVRAAHWNQSLHCRWSDRPRGP